MKVPSIKTDNIHMVLFKKRKNQLFCNPLHQNDKLQAPKTNSKSFLIAQSVRLLNPILTKRVLFFGLIIQCNVEFSPIRRITASQFLHSVISRLFKFLSPLNKKSFVKIRLKMLFQYKV